MFFRNLTLFRVPPAIASTLEGEAFEAALAGHALKPCGPVELSSRGFVSPFGAGCTLSTTIANATLIQLGTEDKILPGSVIARAVREKLAEIESSEGRTPGARERKRIRDAVTFELLPRAFPRPGQIRAHVDLQLGLAIIDTSSRTAAARVVTAVREALGSFPVVPAQPGTSLRALMTAWVAGEPLPEGFSLGEECELRDPVDGGARIRVRDQDLDAEEVREHLRCGKQVVQLAMQFEGRLSFVLADDLVLRKLKFLELATEALDHDERQTQAEDVDARFALQVGELRRLMQRLETVLSLAPWCTE